MFTSPLGAGSPALPDTCAPPSPIVQPRGHDTIDAVVFTDTSFFGNTRFDLPTGLITVVGGSGAGKTMFLQSCRHALGIPATDPRAEKHHEQVLFGLGSGSVDARVTNQHGQGFGSSCKGDKPPVVKTALGKVAPIVLDGGLFKAEFYSQNEIVTMADNPRAQLRLIDKFAPAEIRAIGEELADIDRRLVANSVESKRLDAAIKDGTTHTADLPSIQAALETLGQVIGPDAAAEKQAHALKVARGREHVMLRALRERHRTAEASMKAFAREIEEQLGTPFPAELAGSPNQALLVEAHAQSQRVVATARETLDRLRSVLGAAETVATSAADSLAAAHAAQEEAYQETVRKLDLDRGRVAERDRLQMRLLELEGTQRRLDDHRRERAARRAERRALVEERAKKLRERYLVRCRIAAEISAELQNEVVVEIVAGDDHKKYLALLLELGCGAKIRGPELIARIAARIHPSDLAELVREDDSSPIIALDESKTAAAKRASRIIEAIEESGRLDDLETVTLEDVAIVKLRVGDHPVPSTELSGGKRCIAILSILLIQSTSVLIIDQPEDQVDNAYITRVLVPTLRRVKARRQVIIATHSANLVVLTEPDRVFVLAATDRHGRIEAQGSLDEVRGPVEEHVEGGREAFLRRAERYGHR